MARRRRVLLYALTTPSVRVIHLAGTPEPLATPTPELLLLVT